ncbi:MAG: putative Sco1/SenC family protein [Frankiales bacterium]|nr:putative Sco1/SenC family protein [Frankiales bacterium]
MLWETGPVTSPTARRCGALLLAAALLSGCAGTAAKPATAVAAAAYHGVEPQPVPQRPSFTLTDLSGRRYDFLARTKGTPTLVYFGYTHCPDECPTAMADIATALRQTKASLRDRVQVLFVTTDPKRDTPGVLRDWLARYSTRIVGLTGTQAEVDAAQTAMGVPPAKRDGVVPTLPGKPNEHVHAPGTAPHTHSGPLGYAVAHANVIFAYDAADRLPVVYPGGVTPADIAADLPVLADPAAAAQEDS